MEALLLVALGVCLYVVLSGATPVTSFLYWLQDRRKRRPDDHH